MTLGQPGHQFGKGRSLCNDDSMWLSLCCMLQVGMLFVYPRYNTYTYLHGQFEV